MKDRDVQTVQQTAKKWKALQLAGALIAVPLVLVLVVTGRPDWLSAGAVLFIGSLGVGLIIVGQALAWWHHG